MEFFPLETIRKIVIFKRLKGYHIYRGVMTPPDDRCPECFNDIYKPFTYCNSCGWVKSEDDEKKKPSKKGKKDKLGKKKGKVKPSKETTVPCPKCGGKVPVESEKRPLKIECPKCGTKGTLKAKPGEKEEKGDKKEKKEKKEKDVKRKDEKKEPEEEEEQKAEAEEEVDKGEEKEEEEEVEEEEKKKPAKKKKDKKEYRKVIPCPNCKGDIIIRSRKRPIRIECESCGKTGTLKK